MYAQMLDQMDNIIASMEETNFTESPTLQAMVIIRDTLVKEGLSLEYANSIVANMEISVGDAYVQYTDRVTTLAERIAVVMANLAKELVSDLNFNKANVIALAKEFSFKVE